ncbi:MAG: cyclic nucleotide-binding domain-containing protein [Xanthomonadales bacterium]|nr:cyclic nucleotide-binding domain-containing protein [Gammaproteobacteria bacterium]MBT8054013.1 cyclic nucleotide-binding domain-containing protein [Gammaproteobacteria bacterium]NND56977.1 cyclic nucleotide-binding domain-containing protein [Xanthomonadales bacterium]NNK51935.1 cyclic nucleotide-binding domain-containing protein [Xanthomonadales bacterium]
MEHLTLAFLFGGLSAASLPLGAAVGIWLNPSLRLTAAVMAFGAGALLCALTLELVVPALAHFPDDPFESFKWMAIGAMTGCLLFIGLDRALSEMGGYLRKHSTIAHRLKHSKKKHYRKILDKLSVLDVMLALPPDEIKRVVSDIEKRVFKSGELICHEEDPCDALFLIESGKVMIHPHEANEKAGRISLLNKGDAFGEMALVTGVPAIKRAEAVEDTVLWEVHKDDFNEVVAVSPGLRHKLGRLAAHHRGESNNDIQRHHSEAWLAAASHNLESELGKPTEAEIISAARVEKGGSNVAVAIWLGIALDGIPESLVIGGSMTGASVSVALVGGLFLANFPESMSSASVMKKQGSSSFNVIAMWVSLMLMTAVGAALGHLFIADAPHHLKAMLEGMAAGAMLAMIAQTMLPEAFEHGGWLTGLMTVVGFLAAIMMGTLGESSFH